MRPLLIRSLMLATLLSVAVMALPASHLGAQRPRGAPEILISAVMIDPTAVPDDRGEWLELHNNADRPVSLAGWRLLSANDPGFTIPRGIVIGAKASLILARVADPALNGGIHAAVAYRGLVFGNGYDWLVLKDLSGATRDSVAWNGAPRGVPLRPHGGMATFIEAEPASEAPNAPAAVPRAAPTTPRANARTQSTPGALVVRLLDVGQGDAVLIQNGGSTVLVDGGPNPKVLGAHLDALGLNGGTIDAVILTHAHADHYQGLRELFSSRRHITVRYFWENQDPSPNVTLGKLRDSIASRVRAGSLLYRDTDDPCANGTPLCTITLKGGAKLHIMRPDPQGTGANNRSPALKLVGPDSASFTMWLAGDAEQEEIGWFTNEARYQETPGMHVDVLKADHHGSCNGVTDRYLDLLRPSLVVVSLGAVNDYGHMHEQAKATYSRHGLPWYRTDQNGTITISSPGTPRGGYSVSVERGGRSMSGPSDRRSTQAGCGDG